MSGNTERVEPNTIFKWIRCPFCGDRMMVKKEVLRGDMVLIEHKATYRPYCRGTFLIRERDFDRLNNVPDYLAAFRIGRE